MQKRKSEGWVVVYNSLFFLFSPIALDHQNHKPKTFSEPSPCSSIFDVIFFTWIIHILEVIKSPPIRVGRGMDTNIYILPASGRWSHSLPR
jgi:hypothetical protein